MVIIKKNEFFEVESSMTRWLSQDCDGGGEKYHDCL
jgi:hypothetical protein